MPKAPTKPKSRDTGNQLKTVRLNRPGASQRIDPLTAYSSPSQSSQSSSVSTQEKPKKLDEKSKGKQKAIAPSEESQLWVDIHEPTTEAELAVHVKKVQDVRNWLRESLHGGPSGKLRKYRKILALTGPAGTAKTSTLRVLSKELGFDIIEWKSVSSDPILDYDYESISSKFESFLQRAAQCTSLSSSQQRQHVILLEDLPNIFHLPTRDRFHTALQAHVANPDSSPIVCIISDAGVRGENFDWRERESSIDVRSVLGRGLLNGPYISQIHFNPIAPTLMRKALNALLAKQFPSATSSKPSKEVVEAVIDASNGDIRSAIMSLQFSSVFQLNKKRSKAKDSLPSAGSREQSLALFHLLGKVLYNKRKGDPPSNSYTNREKTLEKELDARLVNPLKLPSHLVEHHKRKASRVQIDSIYADSPVDSSLFSLYIHQNYLPFCNEVEECEGICENLSLCDLLQGENNAHHFYMLALGTLHGLPVPVTRRGQKMSKPDWFSMNKEMNQCADEIEDICLTLPISLRNRAQVATELGGVFKARCSHTRFWKLDEGGLAQGHMLDEHELVGLAQEEEYERVQRSEDQVEDDWWLEEDDIVEED